jgi:hypothetical protein
MPNNRQLGFRLTLETVMIKLSSETLEEMFAQVSRLVIKYNEFKQRITETEAVNVILQGSLAEYATFFLSCR